ncbi:hypothetical protein V5O48_013833, partial [Marasmius crinis-equi]
MGVKEPVEENELDSSALNNWTFNTDGWAKSSKWQGFYETCLEDKLETEVEGAKIFSIPVKEKVYLVRDCYPSLSAEVKKLSGMRLPVLIMGQPGTGTSVSPFLGLSKEGLTRTIDCAPQHLGKSIALYYLLGQALSNRKTQPSILVTPSFTYVFYDREAWEIETSKCGSGSYALPTSGTEAFCQVFVDWDLGAGTISDVFLDPAYTIVQAAFPDPQKFAWRTQVSPVLIGLPNWRKREIIEGFPFWRGSMDYVRSLWSALVKRDSQDTRVLLLEKWFKTAQRIKYVQAEVQEAGSDEDDADAGPTPSDADLEVIIEREAEKGVSRIYRQLARLSDVYAISVVLALKILVTDAMRRVGPCPRDIYEYIHGVPVQSPESIVDSLDEKALQTMDANFPNDLRLDRAFQSVVMVTPLDPGPGQRYLPSNRCAVAPEWFFTIKSADVKKVMMQKLDDEDEKENEKNEELYLKGMVEQL